MMIVPPPEGLEQLVDAVLIGFVVIGIVGVLCAFRLAGHWRRGT